MATKNDIYQTIIWSLTFYGILAIFLVISSGYTTALETSFNPIFVVLALVPFVFFLVVTDQLKGFRGAGIEIMLGESAQREVSRDIVQEIILPAADTQDAAAKGSIRWDEMTENPPTTLSYTLGRDYSNWSNTAYIEHLLDHPQLRYVLFVNEGPQFEGYMHADDYENLLYHDVDAVVSEIQTEDILSRDSVNTESIRPDKSYKDALELMNNRNINEVAVVGSNDEFIGVIHQDDIVRRILTAIIQD